MIKDFKNVKEMIKGLSEDDKFKEDALNEIENKTIAKFLFILRCEHNLTQKELANKIGCTQSRISKIESSYNDEITIRDLLDYGNALNLQLEIGYQNKNTKIVDQIKYHVFKIKSYLESLVNLIDGDKDLAKSVFEFHLESYANMTNFILKNIPHIIKDIPDLCKNSLEPSSKESICLSAPHDDKLEKV